MHGCFSLPTGERQLHPHILYSLLLCFLFHLLLQIYVRWNSEGAKITQTAAEEVWEGEGQQTHYPPLIDSVLTKLLPLQPDAKINQVTSASPSPTICRLRTFYWLYLLLPPCRHKQQEWRDGAKAGPLCSLVDASGADGWGWKINEWSSISRADIKVSEGENRLSVTLPIALITCQSAPMWPAGPSHSCPAITCKTL